MFKISKRFKLFSNIKKVVSSSLIICAIFSNVSLSAVSLREAKTFLQRTGNIIMSARNLCCEIKSRISRVGNSNRIENDNLGQIIMEFDNLLKDLKDRESFLDNACTLKGDAINDMDIDICSEEIQFYFNKCILINLDLMKCSVNRLDYLYSGRDFGIIEGWILSIKGFDSNF